MKFKFRRKKQTWSVEAKDHILRRTGHIKCKIVFSYVQIGELMSVAYEH